MLPAWNNQGVLPPIRPGCKGSDQDRSPYHVPLASVVERFAATYDEYMAISSEIKELEDLLAKIPAENVIDRMGLTARLESAQSLIATTDVNQLAHKARLTFRGKPVYGSHGIAADFAAKAASDFTDAVAAMAGDSETMQYMGPIPDKQKNQLLITGTAIGSFGFEFEVPPQNNDDLFPEESRTEVALTKLQELLRLSAEGSDDEVADIVEDVHPRAVKKVADFLDYVAQQGASCAVEFKDRSFRFDDPTQVQRSVSRLREDNIREENKTFSGEFQGVLPTGRTFEFKVVPHGTVLRGKIGPEINNPDDINRELLHHPVRVSFHVIQVGQGRPRYTLMKLEDISLGLGEP